ncbi:MAG: hypothetical protein SFT91_03865 [Rickettsiaceae bacterium]|nr:hypothetical protein [Rickettsiaceae bacterium]
MSNFNEAPTTKGFYLGSPEAEGESNSRSRINLSDVFEDYLGVLDKLKYEKFIITGRKGSGKSAIAVYINNRSKQEYNLFCTIVRGDDISFEKIIQQKETTDGESKSDEYLFKWIILVKLIALMLSDQSISTSKIKGIRDLSKFMQINRGFTDIHKLSTSEIVQEKGGELNIENFKPLFTLRLGKKIQIRGIKAPYYKLVSPLQETVISILSEYQIEKGSPSEYYIIFDDLDIGYSATDSDQANRLVSLIRSAKEYNHIFAENNIRAKIIIMLRDDMAKNLVERATKAADSAKLFSSYEIPIIWYDSINFHRNEYDNPLIKLIAKRIEFNFQQKNIPYNKINIWNSFLKEEKKINKKSPIKTILDYTFLRPRDLLLLFRKIGEYSFSIPVRIDDISRLLEEYAQDIVFEMKDELKMYFSSEETNALLDVLRNSFKEGDMNYAYLKSLLHKNPVFTLDEATIIKIIFEHSLIGIKDLDGNLFFKYREKQNQDYKITENNDIVLHNVLKLYFKMK